MADSFRCTIVTPSDAIFDGEVRYVSMPSWDGQQGIMAGQSPLLTRLGIGSLRLDTADGATTWYMVDGGFAQILGNELTIITERALAADQIDASEASAELSTANASATAPGGNPADVETAQARARAKKSVAQHA